LLQIGQISFYLADPASSQEGECQKPDAQTELDRPNLTREEKQGLSSLSMVGHFAISKHLL
jgi:hypothetical protein